MRWSRFIAEEEALPEMQGFKKVEASLETSEGRAEMNFAIIPEGSEGEAFLHCPLSSRHQSKASV